MELDLAELLGWHAGDGSLYRTSSGIVWELRGNLNEKEFYDTCVTPLLSRLGFTVIPAFRKGGKNGCYGVRCCKKEFTTLLQRYYVVGRKTKIVTVPKEILTGTESAKCAFLRGLFATDGTMYFSRINGSLEKTYPHIELCSASISLRDKILFLLKELGMSPYGWRYTPKRNGGRTYFLRLAGKKNLQIFRERVGFGNPKHVLVVDASRNV